nr:MAG TPA: hypothetical protein [Caudoviricetes sp.]
MLLLLKYLCGNLFSFLPSFSLITQMYFKN